MMLPGLLKAQSKCSEVGFFLHIPFPSYEIFRLLPESWREEILKNLIQADLIGLQTKEYVNHFLATTSYILGIEASSGNINYKGHLTQVSDYPISIDYEKFNNAYDHPSVQKNRKILQNKYKNVKLIFSVDRLDYTKGVLNRLSALEKLLEENPEYREKVIFILNVIPSRDELRKYSKRKKLIEENIGRINGKYGNINWQPVIYQYRHLSFNQLLTFYTACDVGLVTPLRDGMNLVAKEYVASRGDKKGVLILSEMAGAVNELDGAIIVNPTDNVKLKESLITALNMSLDEQSKRMGIMQGTISKNNVNKWSEKFLSDLKSIKNSNDQLKTNILSFDTKNSILETYKKATRRLILLDYDGTLSDYVNLPEEATPSRHVLQLIKDLSAEERNHVCILSGRKPEDLEKWFGGYDITLVAEHGCIYKLPKSKEWLQMGNLDISWKESAKEILQKQVLLYPGSFVEEKIYSIVWHYRNTNEKIDEKVFIELNKKLSAINQNNNFRILHGNKVLEVKCSNINKGIASSKLLLTNRYDFVLAIGDDLTDEEMFNVLNEEYHVTIKVGMEKTMARYNLISINNVLSFLDQINSLN
jgi:trehalose 6-phosphate synthase/phosphatase